MIDEEIQRLAQLLGTLVRLAGIPAYSIERQLGMSKGTLTKVFKGQVELRVRHILLVLQAIQVPPEQFFGMAYGPMAGSGTGDPARALLDAMKQVGFRPDREDQQAESMSDEEFDRRVEAVLRRHGVGPVDVHQPKPESQLGAQHQEPKRKR
jgi:transcriptional regulator with XRE-family HTH domain